MYKRQIMGGLTKLDHNFEIKNNFAEKWYFDDNNKIYFSLKKIFIGLMALSLIQNISLIHGKDYWSPQLQQIMLIFYLILKMLRSLTQV